MFHRIREAIHRFRDRWFYRVNPALWETPIVTDGSGVCDHADCLAIRYNNQQIHTMRHDRRIKQLQRNSTFIRAVNAVVDGAAIFPPIIIDWGNLIPGLYVLVKTALTHPNIHDVGELLRVTAETQVMGDHGTAVVNAIGTQLDTTLGSSLFSTVSEMVQRGESPATVGISAAALVLLNEDGKMREVPPAVAIGDEHDPLAERGAAILGAAFDNDEDLHFMGLGD